MILRRSLIILIAILLPATAFAAKKYMVKKGDNLYDLSKKFGISIDEIKSANELNTNRLDVGDELVIPAQETSNEVAIHSNTGNHNVHIVSNGDTLSEIAKNYGVTTENLKTANGLKNTNLQIGQKLQIPVLREETSAATQPEVATTQTLKNVTDNEKAEATDVHTSAVSDSYTVQKGDTIGHLAIRFNTTSGTIKKANNLKNDRLHIGQVLLIPNCSKPTESAPKTDNSFAGKNTEGIYTVQKGDTPSKIAKKLGVKTDKLIELNNINSTNLQIGQKLAVPGYIQEQKRVTTVEVASHDTSNVEPADAPPANQNAQNRPAEYIVKKGDTPSEIADKLGVRTQDLIELNGINSKNLRIGQRIVVPGSETERPTASVGNIEDGNKESKTADSTKAVKTIPAEYTVQSGDNLYDISKKFGTTVDRIKKNNKLKSNNLRIGQKLVLNSPGTVETVSTDTKNDDTEKQAAVYTGKYIVRKGDTIGHLAIKFGVSQTELKNANGLRSNILRIGHELKVPEQESSPLAEKTSTQLSDIYIKKRYVVKSGDSLGGIANKFGVSVDEIKKASALKNDVINASDILLIPVAQETVTTSKYTVSRGDTLGKIAGRFSVTVTALKNANGMTSDKIWVGMKLNIPRIYSSDTQAIDTNTAVTTQAVRSEYVVKKGDSLGLIAKRYGVSLSALKRENNIKSNIIRVGQVLYIPGYVKPETKYIAVSEKPILDANSNAHYNEPEVKNGRFSKESIIQVAKKYLGAPYKFGGYDLTTGIDCSGYVKKIFSRFNVELPRTARDIYYKAGYRVAKSQLDTGDLVFFQTYAKYPSHVGIYIGNEEFIHASSASRKVTIDSINKRYYRTRYVGAKRVQLSGLFYDEYSQDYRGFEN